MPFNSVKEEFAKEFGVPVECQRFWTWAKRQNHTYRPYRPLTRLEETQSVGQLTVVYKKNNNELNLFLETVIGPDLRPVPPPKISEEDILVFFKLYDPEKSQLRYVGRLFVRRCGEPTDIISELKESAGFSRDEEIQLYEEIKYERYHELEFEPCVMCERLDKRTSFKSSQIKDGDIICFQKLSHGEDKYQYPDVPSFLEYVKNRQVVRFRSLDMPKEDAFSLELSKLRTYKYDDVADRVTQNLGLDDPSKLRFIHDKRLIKYQGEGHLLDMLGHYNQVSDIIMYYKLLDIPPLPELSCLKTLKITYFNHATTTNEEPLVIHNITLPKQSIVGDVLTEIKIKVKVHPDAELRLLRLFRHRIFKVFTPTETIEGIDDVILRAEKIPEEEKDLGSGYRRIHVYHFIIKDHRRRVVRNFGDPFFLVIRLNETLADVKHRIQQKLHVPDEEFSNWKFAYVYLGGPKYLQDSDIVSNPFLRTRYSELWPAYLGLEHSEDI